MWGTRWRHAEASPDGRRQALPHINDNLISTLFAVWGINGYGPLDHPRSRVAPNDLRISVRSMRLANGLLPRIIAEYHLARPAIELRVREGVHGAVLEDIRSGVADLGITFVDELPDTIAMMPLGREVFHAVMPRQHRLAPSRGVTMKQIAREPLVSLPNDSRTRRTIDAAASKQGITLQHAVTVTQLATVMSFVRAGLGVAIVPAGAIAGFNTDGLKTLPIRFEQ